MGKEKVRRPTRLEVALAITGVLFDSILGEEDVDPEFKQIQLYFQGPLKKAFLRYLEFIVQLKDENAHVELDPKYYGVLIKRD